MEVDLVALHQNAKIDTEYLKAHSKKQVEVPGSIPLQLAEAYRLGQMIIDCVKSWGEEQKKNAELSKQDKLQHDLLMQALNEAKIEGPKASTTPLRLIIDQDKSMAVETSMAFRISHIPG